VDTLLLDYLPILIFIAIAMAICIGAVAASYIVIG